MSASHRSSSRDFGTGRAFSLDRVCRVGFMELTLTAVFEEVPQSEGGGYVAYAEELPGAISEGETLEEARNSLRDANRTSVGSEPRIDWQTKSGQNNHPEKNYRPSRVIREAWRSVQIRGQELWLLCCRLPLRNRRRRDLRHIQQ